MIFPILKIKPPAEKRIRTGHPWIFSDEVIQAPKGLDPGQPVDIKNRSGDWVGRRCRSVLRDHGLANAEP